MIEVLKSVLVGFIFGGLTVWLNLPLPGPTTIAWVMWIVWVYCWFLLATSLK